MRHFYPWVPPTSPPGSLPLTTYKRKWNTSHFAANQSKKPNILRLRKMALLWASNWEIRDLDSQYFSAKPFLFATPSETWIGLLGGRLQNKNNLWMLTTLTPGSCYGMTKLYTYSQFTRKWYPTMILNYFNFCLIEFIF